MYQRVDPGLNVPNDGAKYGVSVYTNELAVEGRSRPLSLLRSLRWWLIEILASLVSVAAFVAIVFVVRHYQGRGVEEVNLPSSLTLNGLIALLSTVNRVALMVPVASALSQEVWTWLCESGEAQDVGVSCATSSSRMPLHEALGVASSFFFRQEEGRIDSKLFL